MPSGTSDKGEIMQNGYRHLTGQYSPETAVGTGALEPLVDEYEAATAVPSVDEHTLDGTAQKSRNKPRSNEDEIEVSGEPLAEPTDDRVSNGEDQETREYIENPHADDAEVNQPAEDVRPAAPQETKASRKRKDTV